jgi:hypothetical protein
VRAAWLWGREERMVVELFVELMRIGGFNVEKAVYVSMIRIGLVARDLECTYAFRGFTRTSNK